MKTLDFPSWYWSGSMLTDWSRWRTPCFSSPFQEGQVALVRMAYLNHQGEEIKTWHQTAATEYHWHLVSITLGGGLTISAGLTEAWSVGRCTVLRCYLLSKTKQLQWEGQQCPGVSHFQMLSYYLITAVVNYRRFCCDLLKSRARLFTSDDLRSRFKYLHPLVF